MEDKELFLKSFIVTLMIVFVGTTLLSPRLGLAQGGLTNVDQGPDHSTELAAGEPAILTDHPQGILYDVEVDDQVPIVNLQDADHSFQEAEADLPLFENNNLERSLDMISPDVVMLEGMELMRDDIAGRSDPGVLVIPGADFRSDGVAPSGYFFSFANGLILGTMEQPCLMAPAYLPHGVTLTGFWASIIDNSPTQSIRLNLYRLDNFTGDVIVLATAQTTAVFAHPEVWTIGQWQLNEVVAYPEYSYYIGACLTGDMIRLLSARVYYDQ